MPNTIHLEFLQTKKSQCKTYAVQIQIYSPAFPLAILRRNNNESDMSIHQADFDFCFT